MLRILTDYYITSRTLASRYHEGRDGDLQQNKKVRIWARSDVFNERFRTLAKMRPLYKLRRVSW